MIYYQPMKCEICHKNDAETVFRREEGGKTRELYVCRECAAKESRPRQQTQRGGRARGKSGSRPDVSVTISGSGNPPPFIEALLSATADLVSHIADEEDCDLVCKKCGTKWSEVEEKGLLGCPGCWGAFAKKLGPRLQAEQRRVAHTGKSPSGASQSRKHIERQLQDAIRKEDYKEAAKLRDMLNALDAPQEEGGR